MAESGSFEKFYYEKVALGESCGCAEQIIATRDLESARRGTASDAGLGRTGGILRNELAGLFRRRSCAAD
ncbi:MAG: hypothetical protein R3316_03605 [Rhodovibrionaceae bacterium]|nr:hypothetical protein [Rhodovibrionaceae bacterium]